VRAALVLLAFAFAGPALAQEGVGCDKFKWPIDRERAMLGSPSLATVSSGGSVTAAIPVAVTVALLPLAEAKLPMPPERAPASAPSFAGFVGIPAPPSAGAYKITVSTGAWVDVVQAGSLVKSSAFSGAAGCEGVRKSVKFNLAAVPFVVQLSGVQANSIKLAITPD
jgi:hypothetical protein